MTTYQITAVIGISNVLQLVNRDDGTVHYYKLPNNISALKYKVGDLIQR